MLTAIALVLGAIAAWRRGLRKQAVLMVALAAVMAANVAIWVVPDHRGQTPLGGELR